MQPPTLPDNETWRLQELRRYTLQNTDQDPRLDQITQLVARHFEISIVLVSFIEKDRQWFKSHHGTDVSHTPRQVSFCAHAILEDSPLMEIPDTALDPRFHDNPLVIHPPHVRYYAGAAIITPSGYKLGTLCMLDTRPRQFKDEDLRQLSLFADQVMARLEANRQQRLLEIIDRSRIGIWEMDVESSATWWSDTLCELMHQPSGHQGIHQSSRLYAADSQKRLDRLLERAIASGRPFATQLKLKDSSSRLPRWIQVTGTPIHSQGKVTHIAGVARKITALKAQEARLARHARLERLISNLQDAFLRHQQTSRIFQQALEELLLATGSQAGFIGEVMYRGDAPPFLKMHALTDISWSASTFDAFKARASSGMEFTDMNSLFGYVVRHQQTVISQAPSSDPRAGGTPPGHPRLDNFLGLPVFDESNQLVAMIGLANREEGYDEAFSKELAPLQRRIGHLMTTLAMRRERAETMERLEMAARVFNSSHNAIMITDQHDRIIEVNPVFEATTGYTRDAIIGATPKQLESPDHPGHHRHQMCQQLSQHRFWEGEALYQHKDGDPLPVFLSVSEVHTSEGEVSHYVTVISDLRRDKQHASELYRVSHFDNLTHLPNRLSLTEHLRSALADTTLPNQIAVVVCDLDRFNQVNQQLGNLTGDAWLVDVAEHLSQLLHDGELAARLGGDEFGLMLYANAHLEERLEQLSQALEQVRQADDNAIVRVSASIGVTCYPDDDNDADTLMRHADQAMYRAKEAGGNCWVRFNTAHELAQKALKAIRADIVSGLASDQFFLELQPQVTAFGQNVIGAEALIRWQREAGRCMPDEFLPSIRNTPIEHDLDEWVLHQAFRILEQWRQQSLNLSISINLTPQTLSNRSFLLMLERAQARYPTVRLENLHVEVLESSAMEELTIATDVMRACQAKGIHVALDDFGTGYSSLTYLKGLPADIVKIDRSFVMDMLSAPDDLAIVESVIYLAQRFGKTVIAEGVETDAHAQALRSLGCDVLQGYGIARPMKEQAFLEWRQHYPPAVG